MPTGMPDWSIHWSVEYGASRRETFSESVAAGATETVLTISGKGAVLAGQVYINDVEAQNIDAVSVYVDSVLLDSSNFLNQINQNQFRATCDLILYSIRYEPDTPFYLMGIRGGFVFEESLEITYWNRQGSAYVVSGELYYSLVI